MQFKRTCRFFVNRRVAFLIICVSVTLLVLSIRRPENSLADEEEAEVVIINRRVQKLRKELQRQASQALLGSELRSMPSNIEDQYEAEIRDDELMKVPRLGDNGVAVILQGEEAKQAEKLMEVEAFNIVLSDKIPFSRKLPDARNPKCKDLTYDSDLPSASVVIVFTNEAWSSLIRTVHSVLNGSPTHLLKEIVLVDDCSDRRELQGRLDYYLRTRLPSKVRLLRLTERTGLIRARLAGARSAVGSVLVFLDAHCEVVQNWLEPLLQRIKEKRTAVLVPIIDVIDDKTFEYMYSKSSLDFFQVCCRLVGSHGADTLHGWLFPKQKRPDEVLPLHQPGPPRWQGVSLPSSATISGRSAHTIHKWMSGVVRTWKCHSECGSVGAPWKPSPALVWGTSSVAFTHTRSQEVRIPMG
ncbi:hypothetical protein B7P43_G11038 [Cryptotermes secundus]|uniref:Glycosyltransferase 2-like domain-containing protein n=1 Tax=Cryptotermes secundus TaxID=105785 RepID=A0A2J7RFA9_9NEOP|nr:hypothetical protein B7P43_G11038 [Cryptotermes secundus]